MYDGHDSMLHQRLMALRNEMRTRSSTQSVEVDAYLVTSYDEHMSDHLMEADQRLQFISGFTGKNALAVVTLMSAALWVDPRYYDQAEYELNCDWKIFRNDDRPNLAEWISVHCYCMLMLSIFKLIIVCIPGRTKTGIKSGCRSPIGSTFFLGQSGTSTQLGTDQAS